MAGKRRAIRSHHEEPLPPAPHTGFRAVGVVVGEDEEQLGALGLLALFPDDFARRFDLLAGGEQGFAVHQRPSVVLRVGEFHPVCVEVAGELDELADATQVVAVENDVQGQREIEGAHLVGEGDLAFE